MLILSSLWEAIKEICLFILIMIGAFIIVLGPPALAIYTVKSLINPELTLLQILLASVISIILWGVPIRTITIYHERKRENVKNS